MPEAHVPNDGIGNHVRQSQFSWKVELTEGCQTVTTDFAHSRGSVAAGEMRCSCSLLDTECDLNRHNIILCSTDNRKLASCEEAT